MSSLILASATERAGTAMRRSPWRSVRANPTLAAGLAILVALLAVAVAAPWLGTVDPTAIAPAQRLKPPSAAFWFGTDMLGRDIYSRVVYGTRVSLLVGFSVAVIVGAVSLVLGLVATFVRVSDGPIMRFMDGLMSVPSVLFAIALMAIVGPSLGNVVFAISVTEVPRLTRIIRAQTLSLRERAFVEAAVVSGTSLPMLLVRHILPNVISPVIVQMSFVCASAMMVEAMLSFLGAGLPPDVPSWGNIVASGKGVFQVRPSIVLIPSVFLTLAVLGVNLLGTGLGRALEPRARQG